MNQRNGSRWSFRKSKRIHSLHRLPSDLQVPTRTEIRYAETGWSKDGFASKKYISAVKWGFLTKPQEAKCKMLPNNKHAFRFIETSGTARETGLLGLPNGALPHFKTCQVQIARRFRKPQLQSLQGMIRSLAWGFNEACRVRCSFKRNLLRFFLGGELRGTSRP